MHASLSTLKAIHLRLNESAIFLEVMYKDANEKKDGERLNRITKQLAKINSAILDYDYRIKQTSKS